MFLLVCLRFDIKPNISLLLLTQHALDLPGVVVPGLDAVLDLSGDVVGVHVLHGAVHAGPVVVLTSRRSSDHISHLRHKNHGRGDESG